MRRSSRSSSRSELVATSSLRLCLSLTHLHPYFIAPPQPVVDEVLSDLTQPAHTTPPPFPLPLVRPARLMMKPTIGTMMLNRSSAISPILPQNHFLPIVMYTILTWPKSSVEISTLSFFLPRVYHVFREITNCITCFANIDLANAF